ncbi:MAG TPA: hypothetical protein VLF91_02480 [Candidatus Saccharimonadales bacterium]|nr:hypothetical protein [Candidatus Saccharimonadales bacterium]
MTKPMQVKSFTRDAIPDLDDELRVSDPATQELALRESGMIKQADKHSARLQLAEIGRRYEPISESDWPFWASYFTEEVSIEDYDSDNEVPAEVTATLLGMLQTNVFTQLVVRTVPDTGEALLLGVYDSKVGTRRFLIKQWGEHLTTIEELRKRRRFWRMIGRGVRKVVTWRPWGQTKLRHPHSWFYYAVVTLLLAAGSAFTLLLGSWWLFLLAFVVAMVLAVTYVVVKEDDNNDNPAPWVVLIMAVVMLIGTFIFGGFWFDHWNTKDYTDRVLVCGVHQVYQGENDVWAIETDKGDKTLDPGYYNGVYYADSSQDAGKSLLGKQVDITWHGHIDMAGPYVTKATTVGPGNCATIHTGSNDSSGSGNGN